jgi:type III pantothenate kinase
MEMKRGLHWILDIGNTRTKLAAFQDGELTEVWVNEEAEHIANAAIEALALPSRMLIAASGMTPDFWSDWNARWNQTHPHPEALIYLTSAMKLGFDVHYESMETVGLDRLANAAAVIHIDATAHWMVIDLGTCLTVDAVEDQSFIGGAISPGIDLRLRSMYAGTHSLPYPENWRELGNNGIAMHIGNDTLSSLLAGSIGGINAEIHGRIAAFKKHWPEIRVAVTGGDASFLEVEDPSPIFSDPNLTWKGYHQILQSVE